MSIPFEMVGTVGLPMAVGLGLVYGLGPCLVSCLPYLGPVFLNSDGGIRGSWRIMLPVALGRLTVYSAFGAISGWWAKRYVEGVDPWAIKLVIGLASLLVGLSLLWRHVGGQTCNRHTCGQGMGQPAQHTVTLHRRSEIKAPSSEPAMPVGLYLMGVGMALAPCAPMTIVLISAASTGSAVLGFSLGLGFGLGAIVAPSLVYGVAVAFFGKRLREELGAWLPRIEKLSIVLFLLLGILQITQIVR